MKLIWCTGIPQIYGQFEGVHLPWVYVHSSICEFLFGVVVLHRSMVIWRMGALVYVHSAICETYIMLFHSIDLWSIRGYICPGYICIVLYVKLICCSGIPQIYGQLAEGAIVYLHSAICETYLVQWYSIDLWSIGGGILLPWVYVHSSTCQTYLVQ